jgi:uncharacterized membrane protein
MQAPHERFVHRLEAFSDIVIGFSLAQLGTTLIVPRHAAAIVDNPGWLWVFGLTFALVCLMWWSHNRIFRLAFAATPITVILNFILLATIVLLVYLAQVFARLNAGSTPHDAMVAARCYFGLLAANYLITTLLVLANIRALGSSEPPEQLGYARRLGTINAVAGVVVLAAVIASLPFGDDVAWVPVLSLSVPIGFGLGRLAQRWNSRGARNAVRT